MEILADLAKDLVKDGTPAAVSFATTLLFLIFMYLMVGKFSKKLSEVSEQCHDRQREAEKSYQKSLELVVDSTKQYTDFTRTQIETITDANQHLAGVITDRLDKLVESHIHLQNSIEDLLRNNAKTPAKRRKATR